MAVGPPARANVPLPSPYGASFEWAWDRVVFFKLLFETGCADVSVRAEWAAQVLSANRIFLKPTVLLCRSLTEHSQCARVHGDHCAKLYFDRKRGNAMKPNLGTFVTMLFAGMLATAAWAQDLGRVHFETSCTPQAQEKFDRGLAMVHSFFYPNSVQAFTEAAAADPQCAIAYWGIAISHRPNPLILPLIAAALKNGLEAVEKGKAIGAKTERERDWLTAIELYYKDYDKIDQTERGLAYERAMETLMQRYPDDPEVAIFYALALNETALHSDKTYAKQLKGGHPRKDFGETTGPSGRAALSDPHLRLPTACATQS